jgi:hypothetical protein
MRRFTILVTVLITVLVVAIPASAAPPEMNVSTYEEEFGPIDNPCTPGFDEILLMGTTTNREILFPNGRRVTAISYDIHSPAPWSGGGTDTGVEQSTGETASHKWIVTNAETGEKIKVMLQLHHNANTDETNPGAKNFIATCIKS